MTCTECDGSVRPFRRGLCNRCYNRHHRGGTLDLSRSSQRLPGAYVVGEWAWLSSHGYTRRQAADRLGMTKAAFEKALERHARTQHQVAS